MSSGETRTPSDSSAGLAVEGSSQVPGGGQAAWGQGKKERQLEQSFLKVPHTQALGKEIAFEILTQGKRKPRASCRAN